MVKISFGFHLNQIFYFIKVKMKSMFASSFTFMALLGMFNSMYIRKLIKKFCMIFNLIF